MTAPSFVSTEQPQYGANGVKSVVGVLTLPTTSSGGTAISAGSAGTIKQLKGLKRVEFLDPKTSLGYVPSFTEVDLKVHGHKRSGGGTLTDIFPDVKGGVNANHLTDQASEGVNAHYVMAITAGNNATLTGAGVTAGLTNPVYPRNLNLGLSSVGGATAVAGNVVVTGTRLGAAQTETVPLVTGAIAAGKFRNRVGTKLFDTVTNVFLDTAQPADILVSIGLGTLIGTSHAFAANGDVKQVQKNSASVPSSTYTASATKQSVDLGADLADNDDLQIQYDSTETDLIDTEAGASLSLGTMRIRAVGW